MWYFLMLFLCVLLLQFILILSIKPPKFFVQKSLIKKIDFNFKILLLLGITFVYILIFLELKDYHRFQPDLKKESKQTITPSHAVYKQLGYRGSPKIDNFYFLYTIPHPSDLSLNLLAKDLMTQNCKKSCILNFYDDTKAYALDMERLNIQSSDIMEDWNNKNYVFVADHYLGYLGPDIKGSFSYYPFRDWYYKKLKSVQTDTPIK